MNEFQMQHRFLVKELTLINHDFTKETSFQLKPLFSKKIDKRSDGEYEVALKVEIKNTPENPFPFDLTAVVALITKIKGTIDEKTLDEYLNKNCVQIIFPYLRSSVTSLTSASLMTPLILPIIDASNFKTND